MTKTTFSPQLCPNEAVDLNKIRYPLLASVKLDGIRCIIKDGELYSRSLKKLSNKHLHARFNNLKQLSRIHNVILDGELYCKSVPFNDLSGIIRSDEKELPDDLAFWCFDLLDSTDSVLIDRIKQYEVVNDTYFHAVPQRLVTCANDVHVMFEDALADGFEGLILRSPMSKYKFGRATVKENIAFKVKPYLTFDSVIVAVTQATVAREGSEKKINELGRSVTSQKKDDRVLIDKAATFIVLHEGKECGISLAMTDEEKIEIWKNKNNYIGRTIEYKGLVIGSKDVPRHCVFVRYRDDK